MLSDYLNQHFVLTEIVAADETGHFYSSVTLMAADGTRVVLEPDAIDHELRVGTKDAMLPAGVIAASVEEIEGGCEVCHTPTFGRRRAIHA